jgi:hypothetical protein
VTGCVESLDEEQQGEASQSALVATPIVSKWVFVAADGTLSPKDLTIAPGTNVKWWFTNATDSVVPTVGNNCTPQRFRFGNANEFTGPMPNAPGGVFALAPNPDGVTLGLVEAASGQPCTNRVITAPTGEQLCKSGAVQTVMDSTWTDPAINGVFIRLAWNLVSPTLPWHNPVTGLDEYTFNFADLDREVDKAVANGKLYSIGVEAGKDGTPDWIFNEDAGATSSTIGATRPIGVAGGVPRLLFQDHRQENSCGNWMSLGLPQDADYKRHYFAMLTAIATHLKENAARYRALAYVKLSGANLYTAENRLPNQCDTITDSAGALVECACNPETWAKNGYTKSGIKQFYAEQQDTITAAFPTKSILYPLLQAGFPRVDDTGAWLGRNDTWMKRDIISIALPNPLGLVPPPVIRVLGNVDLPNYVGITGVQTTEEILADGYAKLGKVLLPQHCGLQPLGAPNQWVVDADPNQYTAFQTQNLTEIGTLPNLELALANGNTNSGASMIEIYEEMRWLASKNVGVLDPLAPVPRTLAAWNSVFLSVRTNKFSSFLVAPLLSASRSFTFTATNKTLYYTVPGKCGAANTIGKITIQ